MMKGSADRFPEGIGAKLSENSRLAGYADAARSLLSDVSADMQGADAGEARQARKARLCQRLQLIGNRSDK
jgi:hypothetical protein